MKQNGSGSMDYSMLRQGLIEERDELVRQANQQIAFINGKIALLEELETQAHEVTESQRSIDELEIEQSLEEKQ